MTFTNIQPEANTYKNQINLKPTINGVIEHNSIPSSPYKERNNRNNPSNWTKKYGNPQCIEDLRLLIITISVKTADIVARLPKVEWKCV
jgi:predicted helicase